MGNQSHPAARVRPQLGLPDRYEPMRHIATGGMASVWCARDRALGRNVAIKLLAERFEDDPEAPERFMREARAAARLSGHPNVVMIYDVGETSPTARHPRRAFIVMEYLAGGTVADALRVDSVRRVHAVKWIHEAASALDYGHSRGVLHRDIKPANLLLDRTRVLHVADFGIARLGAEDRTTGSGQVLGTASYLAPERAMGRPATNASDRYSLAVVAFELLVGERPFTAPHFAVQARQHVEDEPPAASARNRALPPAVDAVLARGMAKRPEQRWRSAQDFAQALEAALEEPATRPMRVAAGTAPRPRRARSAAAAAAAGVVAGRSAAAAGTRGSRSAAGAGTRGSRSAAGRTGPVPVAPPAGQRAHAPAPRTGTVPSANGRGPRRRGARVPALAALAAGAAVAIAVAGALGGGGAPSPKRPATAAQRQASVAPPKTHQPSAPAPAPPPRPHTTPHTTSSVTVTPAAATTPAPLSDTLEARGHQLMLDGNYSAAISVLRQAVSAAPPGSLIYAYALYDLGRSLRLSGDPQDAVRVLYQRLQIPNQTEVVRQQLQQALLAIGAKTNSGGAAAVPGRPAKHGRHHHHHGHGKPAGGGSGGRGPGGGGSPGNGGGPGGGGPGGGGPGGGGPGGGGGSPGGGGSLGGSSD